MSMIEDSLMEQMSRWTRSLPPLPPGWMYEFVQGDPRLDPKTNSYEITMEAIPRQKFVAEERCAVKDNQVGKDALDFFFGLIGVFNHYSFFTEKLWKKVDGFKDKDEAEVKCAFMSLWTNHALGIVTYPVGSAWSTRHVSMVCFEKYLDEWMPLFMAFKEWADKQR
jgi:hypothetical protein